MNPPGRGRREVGRATEAALIDDPNAATSAPPGLEKARPPEVQMLYSLLQLCAARAAILLLNHPPRLLLAGLEAGETDELLAFPLTGPEVLASLGAWTDKHSPACMAVSIGPRGRRLGRVWLLSPEPLDVQPGVLEPVLAAWACQMGAGSPEGATEQRRAEGRTEPELSTAHQHTLYRLLEESVPTLVQTFDHLLRRVYISPSSRRMLGYAPEELLSRPADALWHPDDRERLHRVLRTAISRRRQSLQLTYRILHADGQERWIDSRIRLLYGQNDHDDQPGQFLGMVASSSDVTSKVRDDQRRGRSHQQTQELFQLMLRLEQTHDPQEIVQIVLSALQASTGYALSACLTLKNGEVQEAQVSGMSQAEFVTVMAPYTDLARARTIYQRLCLGQSVQIAQDQDALVPGDHASRRLRQILLMPVLVGGELGSVLLCATLSPEVRVEPDADLLVSIAAERLSRAQERLSQLRQLEEGREETLRALGRGLEYRDHETKGHTDRVTRLAEQFGRHLGLKPDDLRALRWGAYLHDTGKMAIPDAILLKPGRLTTEEFTEVKRHTDIGHSLLEAIPTLPPATLSVVRSHHERWDGHGYPQQLAGEQIPLLARIFSLVDVYDALTSERPYKAAYPQVEALTILELGSGSQFDPGLTAQFLELVRAGRLTEETRKETSPPAGRGGLER